MLQRITSGVYREVWTDTTPLDGGSSVTVTTNIRVDPGALSQVFGVLALRSLIGTPKISYVAGSLNGRLAITIVNSGDPGPGNSSLWQLDVWRNHSISQGRDENGGAAIYIISPPSTNAAPADWPISIDGVFWVRYVFLDGDNGDDANVGYIDAPLGTEFTPAQTAAVTIKTTSRLEQLRPMDGAGRLMQIFVKPRVGGINYDHLVAGDGLGRDDRRLLSGYVMMYLRGSDLTNSDEDRAQLGFVVAHPGPNPDGSFNVLAAAYISEGMRIQTDGTFPAGADLTKCRLRVVAPGVEPHYAPIRWSSVDNNNVVNMDLVVWFFPGPINPGDKLWIEKPDAALLEFTDAFSYNHNEGLGMSVSVLAGIHLTGNCRAGAITGGPATELCAVVIDGTLAAVGPSSNMVGSSAFIGSPPPAPYVYSNFGVIAQNIGFVGNSISLSYSGQINSLAESAISASYINLGSSQAAYIKLSGGTDDFQFQGINYGRIRLDPRGPVHLEGCRGVTDWLPNIMVNLEGNPTDSWLAGLPISMAGLYNLRLAAEGSEPASPGITLTAGVYTVAFDFRNQPNSISPGNGLLLYFDESNTKSVLVTYATLLATGFEVEGAQKVTCRRAQANYPGDVLPCPRGIAMQMVDGVAGTAYSRGLVVSAPAATPDRFDIAVADDPAHLRVIGALLTNVVQGSIAEPGGYALVGSDAIMVLRQEGGSAVPVSGDELWVSATEAGTVRNSAPGVVDLIVARAIPVGPNAIGAGVDIPSAWR
jgi:hypothetical protein